MSITTFTMQDVVDGVLNMLRFAPGRDVQIHLQPSIIQDASMLYRTLMTKYVWRDFMFNTTVTINGTTGQPVGDITGVLDRFSNIIAIYKDKESQPLPFAPARVNLSQYQQPCIAPSPAPYIFAIWPHQAMTCFMESKKFDDTDFDLTDVIPFYKDLLVLGTSLQLCTKAGINRELSDLIGKQFDNMLNTYLDQEVKPQYQVNYGRGGVPMEWYSYDN